MGTAGYTVPPSSGLVPSVPPSQRCGLCQNFKQTTLTTRLYKVRTNLYPPPTKTFRRAWKNDLPTVSIGSESETMTVIIVDLFKCDFCTAVDKILTGSRRVHG